MTKSSLVPLLLALGTGACASSGGVPKPFPGATPPPVSARTPDTTAPADTNVHDTPKPFPGAKPAVIARTPDAAEPPDASAHDRADTAAPLDASTRYEAEVDLSVVETALGFRGVPYRHGGSDPAGFDCSGLVQYVFAQHGVPLPREVREQFTLGVPVSPDRLQPGDLIFFSTISKGASHVGLAIGGDEFVHAPNSRGRVRVERFSSSYWSPRMIGVRRMTDRPD